MGADRKLDAAAVDRIVAERAIRRTFRHIGAGLGVSHTTVSRRVRSDPETRARIAALEKREARRARDRDRKARAKARRSAEPGQGTPPAQERPGPSSSRPHGRRDQLRAARLVLRDLDASFDDRDVARGTLLELLEATRSNGRPAYSLRLPAAKALLNDPAATQEFAPPPRPSPTSPAANRAA